VIVKNVTRDDHEVDLELSRFLTELLEGGKSGLGNAVAGVLIKPRDAQTQVKISSVKELDHQAHLSNRALSLPVFQRA
jgi:hypothetical protein